MAYPTFNPNAPLPVTGYLRLVQIIGNPKSSPPLAPILPIGRTSFLKGVKDGKYPKAIKLGPKTTVWKVEDIKACLASFDPQNEAAK